MAQILGYAPIEVPIDRDVIDFALTPSTSEIEQIQVVAYGVQKRESVIGAISSVRPGNLVVPTAKISTALAGQLAGVVAVQRTGEPGSGAEFWIRGVGTFGSGANPLVIVDGIERDMDMVDPEDIESFSILKDAAATAVYGVRGANGVFIITTKRGSDSRPKIKVTAEAGITGPAKMPKMVNSMQYAELYNKAFGSEAYTPATIEAYRTGSDPDLYPNVDWLGSLFKKFSQLYRVNTSVTGGGQVARYYISGSFSNEGSIMKEDASNGYDSSISFNRFSFRSNVDVNLSPSTILAVSFANIYDKKTGPGGTGNDNPSPIIWEYAFNVSPNAYPIRWSDGRLSAAGGGDTGYSPYNLMTQSGFRHEFNNTAQAVVNLKQDFSDFLTEGLTADIKFSWDAQHRVNLIRIGEGELWTLGSPGRDADGKLNLVRKNPNSTNTLGAATTVGGYRIFYLEGSLAYNRVFNDTHRVGGLLLYNQRERFNINVDAMGSVPYRNQGLAGRLSYDYRNRYLAELNFGYNGSERFASGNRFGFFPSGAVGWLVSEEKFWEPIRNTIDQLKLRASYGVVGNDDISASRFIYLESIVGADVGYTFGGTSMTTPGTLRQGVLPNPSLSWETESKLDIGLEISFINRLKLTLDYFSNKRTGIFGARKSIPSYAGFSTTPNSNYGAVDNRGFEAAFEWDQQFGRDWTVSSRANFTYNRSAIVNDDQLRWMYPYQTKIGKSLNQIEGLISQGLFSSQEEIDNWPTQTFGPVRVGDVKYVDVNGDGQIDAYDKVAIGYGARPEINYGFGVSVKWKNLDLSVFFQGVAHTSFIMQGSAVRAFENTNPNRQNMYEDVYYKYWSPENPDPNAEYPRLTIGANPNNYQNSTYWLRDASFIRLKNAEIGYTLPRQWTSKLRMDYMRFYISGTNLLTFSKFKLWDPEKNDGQGRGYPPNRVCNFGLTINL
jgi:TonB-linked SusC/RagA family outer membrane protein